MQEHKNRCHRGISKQSVFFPKMRYKTQTTNKADQLLRSTAHTAYIVCVRYNTYIHNMLLSGAQAGCRDEILQIESEDAGGRRRQSPKHHPPAECSHWNGRYSASIGPLTSIFFSKLRGGERRRRTFNDDTRGGAAEEPRESRRGTTREHTPVARQNITPTEMDATRLVLGP